MAVQLRLRVAFGLQTLIVKSRLLTGENTVRIRGDPPFRRRKRGLKNPMRGFGADAQRYSFCLPLPPPFRFNSPVAQLPERDASNVGDVGESPSGSANFIYDLRFTIDDFYTPVSAMKRLADSDRKHFQLLAGRTT